MNHLAISTCEPRNHRVIQLDVESPKQQTAGQPYSARTVTRTRFGTTIEERSHDGEILVVRTTTSLQRDTPHGDVITDSAEVIQHPRYISFDWIKRQATITADDYCPVPWVDEDGWEHCVESFNKFNGTIDEFRKTRGYLGNCKRVVLTADSFCGESTASRIAGLRARGASKQVAYEGVAAENRNYIEQIVAWRTDGYPCSYLKIEIDLCGKLYEASYGGVDNDYVKTGEPVEQLAVEIAYSLEQDGFTVTGHDRIAKQAADTREGRKRTLKYHLNMFNWSA